MLEKLLTLSIDINSKTSLGLTPLHFAAFNGNLDAVNSLIEHGADQTAVDNDSKSVLHFAAEGGNTATIERMLKLPIDVNCRDSQGRSPLHHAACRDNLDAVNFLTGHGADQTTESTIGNLLHYAAEGGDVKTIEHVLTLGFLVDSKSSEGETPLHRAALGGKVAAVDLLLSRGATPTAVSNIKMNLLHIAVEGGDLCTIEKVMSLPGVDIQGRDSTGHTPFIRAALGGNVAAMDLLIRHGADNKVLSSSCEHWNILHAASQSGSTNVIDKCISLGVDIDSQISQGVSPLHVAAFKGSLEAFNHLVSRSANLHVVNVSGWNVLHCASRGDNARLIERVLSLGFDINSKTKRGSTALDIALEENKEAAVQYLITRTLELTSASND